MKTIQIKNITHTRLKLLSVKRQTNITSLVEEALSHYLKINEEGEMIIETKEGKIEIFTPSKEIK